MKNITKGEHFDDAKENIDSELFYSESESYESYESHESESFESK